MACDCGSPDCPERHGITLRPMERTPCEHLYDIACRELSEAMAQRDELRSLVREAVEGLSQGACLTCGAEPGCNIDCAGCDWIIRAQRLLKEGA
jgi:hypothetical protein